MNIKIQQQKKERGDVVRKVAIFSHKCTHICATKTHIQYQLTHKHSEAWECRQKQIHAHIIPNCGLIWFLTHSYLRPFLCKFTALLHPLTLSFTALATLATGQILKQPRRLWSCWIQMMTRPNKEAFHTDSSVTPSAGLKARGGQISHTWTC